VQSLLPLLYQKLEINTGGDVDKIARIRRGQENTAKAAYINI